MSVGIQIQFLAGRYHATPWEHQVNEGVVEWPPSPWRILRALVSAYYRLPSPPTRTDLGQMLTCLAECLPIYVVPEHTIAHTRHYMPIWKEGEAKTTKVFDTFVVLAGGAFSDQAVVKVVWQNVELNQQQRALLALLCRQVNYLGRAESWAQMQLIDDCIDLNNAITSSNAFPTLPQVQLNFEQELIRLLVPLSAVQMEGWKAAIASLPNQGKTRCKIPVDVLETLELDIGNLHKEGWNGIPGTRWVTYILQKPSHSNPQIATKVSGSSKIPTFARFALASKVLPNITEAVSVGERFRQALMALSRDSLDRPASVFSGRKFLDEVELEKRQDEPNVYLKGHQHAWYLPEVNHLGQIDHVVVYATTGFDYLQAIPALKNLSKVWSFDGFDIQTILINLGRIEDYVTDLCPQNNNYSIVGESKFWRSLTPMVLPRHPKCYRNGVKKCISDTEFQIDGPEDQALKLLANLTYLSIPADNCVKQADGAWLCLNATDDSLIVKVRCCSQGVTGFQWQAFKRRRRQGDGRRSSECGYWLEIEFASPQYGPIALGYAAHFGLGVFVPVTGFNDINLDI